MIITPQFYSISIPNPQHLSFNINLIASLPKKKIYFERYFFLVSLYSVQCIIY